MNAPVRLDAERQIAFGAASAPPLWATWGRREIEDLHSWPCFSPGGARWAAFRVSREGAVARLVIGDARGREVEGLPLQGGMPIYASWSPSGARVGVLLQAGDRLLLHVAEADAPERTARWLEGSPLFFAWVDDDAVVVHAGRDTGRRAARTSVGLARADRFAPFLGAPGGFCTPVPTPAGVVWVAQPPHVAPTPGAFSSRAAVVLSPPTDASGRADPARELEVVDGLVALVPTGDGRVLRSVSADQGGMYQDLRLLDPRTGRSSRVSDGDHLAFLAVPGQGAAIVARRGAGSAVRFVRVPFDGADETVIGEVVPSRDTRFWLRFFEQFTLSHPLVDPTGAALVIAGTRPGGDADGSHVWRFPLAGGAPEDLGAGPFACFAPPPPPTEDAPS